MKKVILFIYRESVGELNVALPIINEFLKYENLNILFYIPSKKEYLKIDSTYKQVIKELGEIFIGKISLIKIFNKIKNNKIYLITTDKAPEFEYKQLTKTFPNAITILMHHAQSILFNEKYKSVNKNNSINDTYKPDFFIVGNKIDYDNKYFENNNYTINHNKIIFLGALNYKKSWLTYLLSKEIKDYDLERKIKQFQKIILVTTRGPHKKYLDKRDYNYQVESIIHLAKKLNNYLFIIKPHPREKLKIYKIAFKQSNNLDNLIISNLNSYRLCYYSDLVISFWSSVIQDCAITNKPVIEFHKHNKKNLDLLIEDENKIKSYFEYYGFCIHTNKIEELEKIIKNANKYKTNTEINNIAKIFFNDEVNISFGIKKILNFNKNNKKNNFTNFQYIKDLFYFLIKKKLSFF